MHCSDLPATHGPAGVTLPRVGTEAGLSHTAAAESYANFAIDHPSANADTPELWKAREKGFICLTALMGRAQANGWAQTIETLDLAAMTWSFVHGFVDLWIGGPMSAPYEGRELIPTLRHNLDRLLDSLDNNTI